MVLRWDRHPVDDDPRLLERGDLGGGRVLPPPAGVFVPDVRRAALRGTRPIGHPGRVRRLPVRPLLTVLLAAVVAGTVAGCTADGNADDRGIATARPAPPAAPDHSQPLPATRAVPVYYAADTPSGPRLQREFHAVATIDVGSAAVREMLGARPLDEDYRTLWPGTAALRSSVTREGGAIVVDLTGVGREAPDRATAALALQQLVLTVQGALQSTDPVRVLVDGQRTDRLWGLVDVGTPVARADQTAVRSLVQIDSPADGATVGRDVVVTGEAAVFEATLPWEVRQGDRVVASGVATTAEGQRFSPYRFTVRLEPGQYVLVVTEDDPSGGAGRPPFTDTKRITVR